MTVWDNEITLSRFGLADTLILEYQYVWMISAAPWNTVSFIHSVSFWYWQPHLLTDVSLRMLWYERAMGVKTFLHAYQ